MFTVTTHIPWSISCNCHMGLIRWITYDNLLTICNLIKCHNLTLINNHNDNSNSNSTSATTWKAATSKTPIPSIHSSNPLIPITINPYHHTGSTTSNKPTSSTTSHTIPSLYHPKCGENFVNTITYCVLEPLLQNPMTI